VSVHQPLAIDVGLAPARERALRAVRDSVRVTAAHATATEPVIPVDALGWEAVLADAAVGAKAQELLAFLDGVTALDLDDPTVIGTELRRMLVDAAELLAELVDRVEQASWFVPPTGRAADRARHLQRDLRRNRQTDQSTAGRSAAIEGLKSRGSDL